MKLNKNYIEIKFFDFSIPHEELTNILGLPPTRQWKKNEEYFVGPKRSKMIRKENYWGYQILTETNAFIGNNIEDFLKTIVVPRIVKIKELTDRFHGEFSVTQYLYDGFNPGFYLDKRQIKTLNDCGLELNIDIYVLSDDGDKGMKV